MDRTIASYGLAMALVLAVSVPRAAAAAHHEPVIQVYVVDVKPGKLDKYMGQVNKLRAVMDRVGVPGSIRVWRTSAAGTSTGAVMVGVEYPSAAAWAAAQPKIEGDSAWRDIMSGLHKLRTLRSSALWRDISPNPPERGAGPVLVVTGLQVKPGKLAEYRARVASMQGISERLGLMGRVRMWQADLAGSDTGNIAVGVEYTSLASYVAEQGKLAGDPEWSRLIAGLDELRTLGGRSLFMEITP